jgi:four helix bundle suffix protein
MAEPPPNSKVFPKSGGFEQLRSYQVAELAFDVTARFVERYIEPGSRTKDQMVQASRSGSRNITEGSIFSATSKKLEMNLTNVAKASLGELKKDYAAFLRQNRLKQWESNDPIRQELVDKRFTTVDAVAQWGREVHTRFPDRSLPEIAGNIGFILANVAYGLTDRQLQSQGREFEKNGGFNERLYKVRTEARNQQRMDGTDR